MDVDERYYGSPTSPTNGLLSTHEDEKRPGSSKSSLQSERSTQTIIKDNPNLDERSANIKRQQTHRVKVHIPSRWACLLGFFFGPRKTAEKTRAIVEMPDMDYDHGEAYDTRDCDFFKILSVLSRLDDKKWIPERCLFDTGCLQGNIVSLKFAMKLGYKETDFQQLRPRERSGISASGHAIRPKGVVLLSWYHSTSPQYTNMRFLVVEDYYYDLVIGAEAIWRHKMMSPPNFSQQDHGVSTTNKGDSGLAILNGELKALKDKRDKLGKERKLLQKKNPNDKGLDAKYEEQKRLVNIKQLQIAEYNAKASLKADSQNSGTQAIVKKAQKEIKNLEKTTSSKTSTKTPTDKENVAPNIILRPPTGFSHLARTATSSLRKR